MDLATTLLTLGALFLAGLVADQIGRRLPLPRVTLLLGAGMLAGGAGLDLIPHEAQVWYEFLSISALTMVAFLLGGALTKKNLRAHGRAILAISLAIVAVTVGLVGLGLWLLGLEPGLALLAGAIASATAPAATQDALRQSGREGAFVDTLKGIVAIDDAWGLLVFSLAVVGASQLAGAADASTLPLAAWEIGGAILVGAAIGLPAAILTGRLTPGEPLQTEALGLVFLTAGIAISLGVSFLLAGMTAGAIIANRARHHARAFHEIEGIQWPFMVLFFLLAGASLEFESLAGLGLTGAAYIVLRIAARILGGWIGAAFGGAPRPERPWFGLALLPQAGVAIGMALVAGERFPAWADTLMALTISTTVAFELFGPAATIFAVRRAAPEPD